MQGRPEQILLQGRQRGRRWCGLLEVAWLFLQEQLRRHAQKGLSDDQVVVLASLEQFESCLHRSASRFD